MRGPLGALSIAADATGTALDRPLTATVVARVNADSDPLIANISRFRVLLGEDEIVLNRPLRITSRSGVIGLKNLDLSLPDDGSIVGDITIAGRPVAGQLDVRLPSLVFIGRLADIPIRKGGVVADLNFGRKGGTSKIRAHDIEFSNVDVEGSMTITAQTNWKSRRLKIEATNEGNWGEPVRVVADLPLTGEGGLPDIASRGPMDVRIDWSGDIGGLWALVPLPGHIITGPTNVDLAITGDISNPEARGRCRDQRTGPTRTSTSERSWPDLQVRTSLLGRRGSRAQPHGFRRCQGPRHRGRPRGARCVGASTSRPMSITPSSCAATM